MEKEKSSKSLFKKISQIPIGNQVSSSGEAVSKDLSAGGGLFKLNSIQGQLSTTDTATDSHHSRNPVGETDAIDVFSVGGGLLKPRINTGHPSQVQSISGMSSPVVRGSVGVLLVQGNDTLIDSPTPMCEDPLEYLTNTPEILPDIVVADTYSPIEDWTANLSRNTPICLEDSVLPDTNTPTPTNSPFWVEETTTPTTTPLNPLLCVEATYSRTTTPGSHGPTTYFSKKLRQRILVSRQKKKSRSDSATPSNVVVSLQKQKLVETAVRGIFQLDDSNKGSSN